MYVMGQGHEHLGPGTSMVQRINWTNGQEAEMVAGFGRGMAGYGGVDEFRPDCAQMSRSCSEKGLGCACGGTCVRGCGLGIFDGGLDTSTWGFPEWGIAVGLGGYVLTSLFFTGRRVGRSVREGVSSRVRAGRRRLAKRVAGA